MRSYVIYNISDGQFFEPFEARNDEDALDFLNRFAGCFGDDIESYALFRDMEVS